jgi:hypothetical protein
VVSALNVVVGVGVAVIGVVDGVRVNGEYGTNRAGVLTTTTSPNPPTLTREGSGKSELLSLLTAPCKVAFGFGENKSGGMNIPQKPLEK